MLIHLRYGVYNSPAPASFLRAGKSHFSESRKFTPHQYISLLVESEIAAGATGVVHNGRIEVPTASDDVDNLRVAVKFAFKPRQQQKLRHEFSIYEHLATSGIEGIPTVFGLFEDTESDTLALIMTHVGVCILDRASDVMNVTVTDSERSVSSLILGVQP
jgi:hypothetical protein